MNERQLTVVIAADALEDRVALREVLLRDPAARYMVIEAESGAHAVELCRARKPDCVVLDRDLRDLSGLDALEKLGAEYGSPACAVVVLVSAGDAQYTAELMKRGAHDCLEKHGARGEALRRAVNEAVERAERRRRDLERERELIEKARSLETSLGALQREAGRREQVKEAWQVARAGGASSGAVVSRPERTTRILAGERLRLLNAAIEQNDESVSIMTAQLEHPGPQIVYVNPAFTRMTGYAPEDVIGKTPHIMQGPKTDRSALGRMCEDCAAGKFSHGEMTIYRKDRSEINLECSVGQVRNERGEITHFVVTHRDVTERRRVEEELLRSEEEFRLLFDLSATGMAQVSPEGRYLRVNRKLCQMLGYSEQEMLHLTLHELTHPDDRELSAAKLSSSFSGEPEEYSMEKRCVRKDGEIIWLLINWTVVRAPEGRPPRTIANVQDITARKFAEEGLRAKEAQLRAILDHSAAVIFVKDLKGRYLRINRRYEDLKGVTEAEVKGQTDYDMYAKEMADAVRANDQEVIAADTPLQFEEQVVLHDGLRYFISVKFPLRDDYGRPYAVCGIATDITERKHAETALRESQALNQAVLDSLAANIAVLDKAGEIIAVNEDWRRFARENDAADFADSLSVNYLAVCRRAQELGNDEAKVALDGIQAVLNGERSSFMHEYQCDSPGEKRWFLMAVTPLGGERGGVVVTHTNITVRKLAEEAIHESESRLRQLADAMPQIVYTCGPDG
ncbi:MAG TPA: PAS domain S-box protein, partial [Blastocatellia bacterium]|nr:PAS domain S-box protein [Blastocatellia bacterium]